MFFLLQAELVDMRAELVQARAACAGNDCFDIMYIDLNIVT